MDREISRAKQVMVDILLDVHNLCRKHGINYWIDFGTLLGAVRHKGFIPWDDDIDITMPRDDYNRFITIALDELQPKYFVQLKRTDKSYTRDWLKIRDRNSVFLEYGTVQKSKSGKHGVFIDIFPLDRIDKRNKKYYQLLRRLYQVNPFKRQFASFNNKALHFLFSPVYLFRGLFFKIAVDKLRNGKGTLAIYGVEAWFFHSFCYEDIFPLTELEFEGFCFKAPNRYEKHLTDYYGDYMKLPPEELRHYHAKVIKFFDSPQ